MFKSWLPRCLAAGVLAALLVVPFTGSQAACPSALDNKAGQYLWIFQGGQFDRLNEGSHALMRQMFNNCNTIVLAGQGHMTAATKELKKTGWQGRFGALYRSYAEFEKDVSQRKIHPDISVVIYTPGTGDKTPFEEQDKTGQFVRQFGSLARDRGFISVASPSCNLLKEKAAYFQNTSKVEILRRCADSFLDIMAPAVDVINLQVYSQQQGRDSFAPIVESASHRVHKASPRTRFITQVIANEKHDVSAMEMLQDVKSVANSVDGFWVSMSAAPQSVSKAGNFLSLLEDWYNNPRGTPRRPKDTW